MTTVEMEIRKKVMLNITGSRWERCLVCVCVCDRTLVNTHSFPAAQAPLKQEALVQLVCRSSFI